MKIAVVADTHCPEFSARLPPRLLEHLAGVDLIIHCGDVGGEGGESTLAQLQALAPVEAVRGDHDRALAGLPLRLQLEFEGARIGVVHGNRSHLIEEPATLMGTLSLGHWWPRAGLTRWLQGQFPQAQVVLYGHTHFARREQRGRQLVFNPGAVYVVTPEEAKARLRARPNWFDWCWLQVIRHRRDRPRPSFGLLQISRGEITASVVGLD
ncbi:MAG TPA: metallophosphoesterase family protein [Candidatus Acidoferrales bacterium]|nr:metallophosphoesterase family protein [Candidatus Acidoferrales bacterium]